MLPRERVITVIRHGRPDRVPLYGWVRANMEKQIAGRFGSVEAFEDRYEFDYAHLFGGPGTYDGKELERLGRGQPITPDVLLGLPLCDPDNRAAYDGLVAQIRHHKEQRGRFVYVQTPGIFEPHNGYFGIENHLMYLLLYEAQLMELYRRQAEWNRRFAMNVLDLGADMVHVSDDWGGQSGLIFSPQVWWRMIYPFHEVTAKSVRARGAFLSLHSDGNVSAVMDGVAKLGYQVVHPWQESAGMSYDDYRQKWASHFVLMGGLDVQTTIGFGKQAFLLSEIERLMRTFRAGGLLFCTSHFVQDHCSIDELTLAYDAAYRLARTP